MLRKCSYDASSAECRDSCIHHGRYCAVDSISDTFSAKFKPHQVRSAAWVHLGMQWHLPALLECACQHRALQRYGCMVTFVVSSGTCFAAGQLSHCLHLVD